jgi:hypothetical protein
VSNSEDARELYEAEMRMEQLCAQLDRTRALLDQAWVTAPMRWSKIDVGRLVVDDRHRVWVVMARDDLGATVSVTVTKAGETRQHTRAVAADGVVDVLMPAAERDALVLLRDQLGAQLATPEGRAPGS